MLAHAVDGERVAPHDRSRDVSRGEARTSAEPIVVNRGCILEREVCADEAARSGERQGQVVPVRTEFQLEVAISVRNQEQLDHLVLPQAVETSGGRARRGIAVEPGGHRDLEPALPEREPDLRRLGRKAGEAVPGRLDAQPVGGSHRAIIEEEG